ncbi:tRNA epoxyqueuosine(34) reductase QueG [Alkalibacter mobilis]|uniref:tRNA epoxyqueuosine(34) reductase QueG n=1 Tax=Alkalibacter mobilis TaxID=2787712 RepID=UPI00189C972D|nr:tRNA epoxyqueuosine(34) reductase QueG [Alkalibacter mobilis]MBF7097211.1 tRNA epoxyqueuosine(34) reductase QueG [Alkalibacter mobilis]
MDFFETAFKIAKNHGFEMTGAYSPEKETFLANKFSERKKKGHIVFLGSENENIMFDPKKYWGKCKSVISLALSYNIIPKCTETNDSGMMSKVSSGIDYHHVIGDKLKAVVRELKDIYPHFDCVFQVDVGPLSDRAAAWHSGLGFYGKNSFVINPDYGSWIFLAQILTDQEYQLESVKIPDGCKECKNCIKACPTGAIKENYDFNGKLCISYLTQKKETLTLSERRAMGKHLYGCDICQEVCPYNKKSKEGKEKSFFSDCSKRYPELKYVLKLDKNSYENYYKKTSSAWRGRRLLQRNAVIVCGNIRNKENLELLHQTVKDPRPEIRLYSLFSLAEYGEDQKPLIERQLGQEDEDFKIKYNDYK